MMSAEVASNPDRKMVIRAMARDREAFTALVHFYHRDLVRVAQVVLGDQVGAEDAAQAAWLKAWARLPALRNAGSVRAWLLTIAVNEARQISRRARRREDLFGADVESLAVASGDDPALIASVLEALSRVTPDERRLIALRYAGGMNSQDIGEALGMSSGAVRHRLMRVMNRIRKEITDE